MVLRGREDGLDAVDGCINGPDGSHVESVTSDVLCRQYMLS